MAAVVSYDKNSILKKLESLLGAEAVLIDEPLKNHTTFKIGGPADAVVLPTSKDQIVDIVSICSKNNAPLMFMGLGSNILCSDKGIRAIVMKLGSNFSGISIEGTSLFCQAGASNEAVANVALKHSLTGYEFASGIPGSIGGAAIMNAGAYDGEFKDVATSVECLTPEGNVITLSSKEAAWSYRHSMMMDKRYLILGATIELTPGNYQEIEDKMMDLQQRRSDKQPLELPSAGSTFKRPEGHFVGKMIQDAGLRGYSVGGAQISEKHCGFVVNSDNASAMDVCNLISDIQKIIYEREGVKLEPEVRMWGF